MMNIFENTYELRQVDGRASFYGKALVHVAPEGETLYSYGTPIIFRDRNTGKLTRLWDGWSMTTGRHVKAFCGLNKAEYEALPFES